MARRWIAAALVIAGLALPAWGAAAPDPLAEGIALYQAGHYAQALAFFQRSVDLTPGDTRSWVWLGATYLRLSDAPRAVPALRRAISLDPTSGSAYLLLGYAYVLLKQRPAALDAFGLAARYAPSAEYAAAARAWMQSLQGGPPAAAVPPRPVQTACPTPARLPAAKAPPAVADRQTRIEVSDVEAALEGDNLVLSGLLTNIGEDPVRDLRVRATLFGLSGQRAAESIISAEGQLDDGDGKEFLVRIPNSPPPLWARFTVVDFAGRNAQDAPDVITVPIPAGIYGDLARRQVRIGSTISPPAAGVRHVICLWIADGAGLPVSDVRVRVRIAATDGAAGPPETRTVLIVRDTPTAVERSWSRSATAAVTVEVERVDLGPVP